MFEILLWITSAPALYNALIVRLILLVLPGIGEELNTTVSSGIIFICLCVPFAILDNAAIGSPWEPVQRMSNSCLGTLFILLGSINVSGGALIYPSSIPILILFSIERPNVTILRLYLIAASTACWTR